MVIVTVVTVFLWTAQLVQGQSQLSVIQSAIDAGSSAVVIPAGTYTNCSINNGNGLVIRASVIVTTTGPVTIDCQGQGRAFTILPSASSTSFTNILFENGNSATASINLQSGVGGGNGLVLGTDASFTSCQFLGGTTSGFGGALATNSSTITLNNCVLSGNSANEGGAVYIVNLAGLANFNNTVFTSNSAVTGGALSLVNAVVGLTNATLMHNSASGSGGAISSVGTYIDAEASTISYNTAGGTGAALLVGGYVVLEDSTVTNNVGLSAVEISDQSTLDFVRTNFQFNNATGNTYPLDCLGGPTTGLLLFSSATLCNNTSIFCATVSPLCHIPISAASSNTILCNILCSPSPSPSFSQSVSPSVSPTQSQTPTKSPTGTLSFSPSPSQTASQSQTPSQTQSGSLSLSNTASSSSSPSQTPSRSQTISGSNSATSSTSNTASISQTPSASQSGSITPSTTPSVSTTPSNTASVSMTPSNTASVSVTPSNTASVSVTPSNTASVSITPSNTASVSITPSNTPSASITPSQTPSASVSASPSPSPVSQTPSPSIAPLSWNFTCEPIPSSVFVGGAVTVVCGIVANRPLLSDFITYIDVRSPYQAFLPVVLYGTNPSGYSAAPAAAAGPSTNFVVVPGNGSSLTANFSFVAYIGLPWFNQTNSNQTWVFDVGMQATFSSFGGPLIVDTKNTTSAQLTIKPLAVIPIGFVAAAAAAGPSQAALIGGLVGGLLGGLLLLLCLLLLCCCLRRRRQKRDAEYEDDNDPEKHEALAAAAPPVVAGSYSEEAAPYGSRGTAKSSNSSASCESLSVSSVLSSTASASALSATSSTGRPQHAVLASAASRPPNTLSATALSATAGTVVDSADSSAWIVTKTTTKMVPVVSGYAPDGSPVVRMMEQIQKRDKIYSRNLEPTLSGDSIDDSERLASKGWMCAEELSDTMSESAAENLGDSYSLM